MRLSLDGAMLRSRVAIASLAVAVAALPRPAFAYVDPSAGSIALQLLLGGAAGLIVIVKLSYRRLLRALGWRSDEPANPPPAPQQ